MFDYLRTQRRRKIAYVFPPFPPPAMGSELRIFLALRLAKEPCLGKNLRSNTIRNLNIQNMTRGFLRLRHLMRLFKVSTVCAISSLSPVRKCRCVGPLSVHAALWDNSWVFNFDLPLYFLFSRHFPHSSTSLLATSSPPPSPSPCPTL